MPSPAWEDLDDFLSEDDFAVPAVIALQAGGQVSLSVLYDAPSVMADLGEAYTREDAKHYVSCKEALVGSVKRGDTITITFPTGPQTFDILAGPQGRGSRNNWKGGGDGMAILPLADP